MEITNELKSKVFAQYIGCKIQKHNLPMLKKTGVLCGVDYYKPIMFFDNGEYEIHGDWSDNYYLLLRSLSKITDEDALEIAKILYAKDKNAWTAEYGKYYIKYVFCDSSRGWMKAELYQYLQSKGYDLPQFLLGGETLQEAGLAIYE